MLPLLLYLETALDTDSEDIDEVLEENLAEEAQESVADIPLEIFEEGVIEEQIPEEVIDETATVDKPSFKERIINFFFGLQLLFLTLIFLLLWKCP